MTAATISPYVAEIPEDDLEDLRARLRSPRWPDELADVGWEYGVPRAYVEALVEYWRDEYDWRAHETRLNEHPQFLTTIDGQQVHFLHVRSPESDALPLLCTHGWPMSVFEYLELIGPLSDPRAHGADAGDAFDLVIPSVPGVAFSGPTTDRGWNTGRIARAWVTLMRQQFTSGGGLAYNQYQSAQPQTLAYALQDSPAGWLAWVAQLFRDAIDCDSIITEAATYWLTGTIGSSIRRYYEDSHAPQPLDGPTTTPTGVAIFAQDFQSIASSPSAITPTS